MRLKIDREQFLKGLNIAGKAIKGSADSLMDNLKIELNEKGLEITGTNNEITIRSLVPYRIGNREIIRATGYGATLVKAKNIIPTIRGMEGEEISFEVIDETMAIINDDRSNYKFVCMKAQEYVDIDLEPNGVILSLPCADFINLVDQTAFAASTAASRDQRPILASVNFDASNGVLVATATDTSRLARKTLQIETDASFRCNVPAKTLIEVARLLEGLDRLTIAVSESSILFIFDNTVFCSRLIAGEYHSPSKAAFPQSFNYILEVNGQELASAMSRASIVSTEHDYVVKLSMAEDEVTVSSRTAPTGSDLENIQTFQYTGEKISIAFDPQFVIDAIRAVKSPDVRLCFQSAERPFVVQNPRDDSVFQLITPKRLIF